MKKILITGANGFIGSELKRKLEQENYAAITPSSHELDVVDSKAFSVLREHKFSCVIHLAAKTFVPDSWCNPSVFFDVNVSGTKNVLEFCREHSVPLIFISAYLYGQPEKLPITEYHVLQPNNPYAYSKFSAEGLCEFYAREFGVNAVVIRPFNIYGPGQSAKFLVPAIIRQALSEDTISLKDLQPKRDYIYVKDVVNAIYLTIEKLVQAERLYAVYNVGSGYSVSVAQLVETIQLLLGTNKPVLSENNVRHNEISDVIADISRINQELKWFPQFSLYEGLRETINEYKG